MIDYKKLHDHNPDAYFLKICEELSELQTAVLHFRDSKVSKEELIDELADVNIQINKIHEVFNIQYHDVSKRYNDKTFKLEMIIKGF